MLCPNPECPDYLADGEPGEYRPHVEVCPVCGTPLVHALPEGWPQGEEPDDGPPAPRSWHGEPEPVFECTDPTEVPVIKSILDGAGIPYLTRGEERFDALRGGRSAARFNPLAGRVVFLVPSDLAEEAADLLQEVEDDRV